jgi:hypothetical protein
MIPVLLDLFFLFGPRVSIAPVVSQIVTRPFFATAYGTEAPASAIGFADEMNLLGLLSPGGLTLPTVVPTLGIARGSFTMVDSVGTALLIALVTLLVGALIGSLYRAVLAQQARAGQLSPWSLPREAAVAWLRLVILGLLIFVGMLAVIFPLVFAAEVLKLVGAGAGFDGLVLGIVVTLALVAHLYLFFAPDAILVSRVGPIQAIRQSIAVVHAGVWSTFALVALVTVALVVTGQIWVLLGSQASWGVALGIVGNAYIASGLVAATMLFYQERMEILLARRS